MSSLEDSLSTFLKGVYHGVVPEEEDPAAEVSSEFHEGCTESAQEERFEGPCDAWRVSVIDALF